MTLLLLINPKMSSISLLPLQSLNLLLMSQNCPQSLCFHYKVQITNVPTLSSISLFLLQSPILSPMSQNCPQSHHFYYKVQICHQCPKIVLNITTSTTKSISVSNVSNLSAISLLQLSTYSKVRPNLSPVSQNCPQINYFCTINKCLFERVDICPPNFLSE